MEKDRPSPFLRSLLEWEGLRVGVFSSPLSSFSHEQISINGLPISDQDLETYLSLYQDLLGKTVLIRPYWA